MLKVSVVPGSTSAAVGRNEYSAPAIAVAAGVPEIVGGVFDEATVIENAGSETDDLPSLTLITTLPYVWMSAAPGVPRSRPVLSSNAAQLGRFAIANESGSWSASLATGWNVY